MFGDLAAAGITIYYRNLQSANMTVTVIISVYYCNHYYTDRPGPPLSKRSRLDASEPSASGASTAGPSSASGLDTKLGEWRPKDHCSYPTNSTLRLVLFHFHLS